jgi:hypothetical protein
MLTSNTASLMVARGVVYLIVRGFLRDILCVIVIVILLLITAEIAIVLLSIAELLIMVSLIGIFVGRASETVKYL